MISVRTIKNASPATLCLAATITLLFASLVFPLIFPIKVNAAERGKCVATHVAAKAKKTPAPEPDKAPKKKDSIAIGMLDPKPAVRIEIATEEDVSIMLAARQNGVIAYGVVPGSIR